MKKATAILASSLVLSEVTDAKETLIVKEDPAELAHSRPHVLSEYTCR